MNAFWRKLGMPLRLLPLIGLFFELSGTEIRPPKAEMSMLLYGTVRGRYLIWRYSYNPTARLRLVTALRRHRRINYIVDKSFFAQFSIHMTTIKCRSVGRSVITRSVCLSLCLCVFGQVCLCSPSHKGFGKSVTWQALQEDCIQLLWVNRVRLGNKSTYATAVLVFAEQSSKTVNFIELPIFFVIKSRTTPDLPGNGRYFEMVCFISDDCRTPSRCACAFSPR